MWKIMQEFEWYFKQPWIAQAYLLVYEWVVLLLEKLCP